jgi:large subunit ribosomal protein L15
MDSPVLKAPAGATKKRKIVGRGSSSGHGGTSTKGSKGQNARAGGGVRLGFEGGQMPLFRRVARRGFSNAKFKVVYRVVNLGQLGERYSKGDVVTAASLEEKGLVRGSGPVKILGVGDAPEGLTFEVDAVSGSARAKIEKAGGAIAGAAAAAKQGKAGGPRGKPARPKSGD